MSDDVIASTTSQPCDIHMCYKFSLFIFLAKKHAHKTALITNVPSKSSVATCTHTHKPNTTSTQKWPIAQYTQNTRLHQSWTSHSNNGDPNRQSVEYDLGQAPTNRKSEMERENKKKFSTGASHKKAQVWVPLPRQLNWILFLLLLTLSYRWTHACSAWLIMARGHAIT